ncbi:neurocalcin-delta-like [Physella acuta]|uniref:neurocalcin-delta-like n=1 Tax=Physella acuta TaxID=109671 RepID=UPI0027DAD87A|nr:neurocalcin-delta-like [Physella acuta]
MSSLFSFFKKKKNPDGTKIEKKKHSDGSRAEKKKEKSKKRGKKGKQAVAEPEEVPDPVTETRRLFYTIEFQCMGDMTKDQRMSLEEFYRLMMLLGFPDGREGAEKVWLAHGKTAGGKMTQSEYIELMFDESIERKTNCWRTLFGQFDTDGNASATKTEVLKGLEDIGLEVTSSLRQKVDEMDTNKDGKISYEEFLRAQLKQ